MKQDKQILSIAMCTYNGGKYLEEQLYSIFAQTRLPDELVVCDDKSTDNTLPILNKFKNIAPFPVKIYQNEGNLGITKNFEKAIMLCQGDIIVLSDQDDAWLSYKLEKLENALIDNRDAMYVFSDAMIVDENLSFLGYTMWERTKFNLFQQKLFEKGIQLRILLKHNVVTGATMAFRSNLKRLIFPIPEDWIHDAWIALIASASGYRGVPLKDVLIKYRQHEKNAIGGLKLSLLQKFHKTHSVGSNEYRKQAKAFFGCFSRITNKNSTEENAKRIILEKIKHLKHRSLLYEGKVNFISKSTTILKEAFYGRYWKFSDGLASITKDIYRLVSGQ